MTFFRKQIFPIAVFAFLTFFTVLGVETAHHHGVLESKNDCSFCAWQQSGSQASAVPVAPVLFTAMLCYLLLFLKPVVQVPVLLSTSGRSPPKNLL